ncbi:MAG: 5-(carboxyamino)imidazole ribonucleotide synthase [Candidatus Diapherotrites archaeon]|nr:5-(carboxyamino)imidazole ribonucleotide synthase [Candidatus Diapherotrites archaeon]
MRVDCLSGKFPRIGIVGGGQLGKMLCLEAKKIGLHVTVLDPTEKCPASSVSDEQIIADFKDETAIRELASKSDFITFEIELANSKVLKELEEKGCIVNPKPETLYIIQSKLRQKNFLKENNLPVPEFVEVKTLQDLKNGLEKFGNHAMLKLSQDSYDGRGNFELNAETNLEELFKKIEGNEMFLEDWVDFEKELSVMVARNDSGEIAAYPVSENIHKESILDVSIIPARVSEQSKESARQISEKVMNCLKGSGVFGIELFLTRQGKVLINEIAPRVHNSGHYTIEACKTSQFEQHLRAILDLPLGSTELLQNVVMVNILGNEKTGSFRLEGLKEVLKIEGANLHIYGKHESKPKRKMGHVTILDNDLENALKKAFKVKEVLVMRGE